VTYGIRARLAWYARRVRGQPAAVTRRQGDVFYAAVLDPKPPWRKPRPVNWDAWTEIGATDEGWPR